MLYHACAPFKNLFDPCGQKLCILYLGVAFNLPMNKEDVCGGSCDQVRAFWSRQSLFLSGHKLDLKGNIKIVTNFHNFIRRHIEHCKYILPLDLPNLVKNSYKVMQLSDSVHCGVFILSLLHSVNRVYWTRTICSFKRSVPL